MPIVQAERLRTIAAQLLIGAGASEHEAAIVSAHSVGANLAGHDSHGIIQIPTYIDRVKRGHIAPGAPFDIIRETPTTTVIDGNWGFGYVVSERAMNITIDKAKQHGVAAATVFRQSHVGRVADYPLMAASADMIGVMTADSGRSAKGVVPFGGREPRLGTNPICIAMPSDLDGPMFIDMATSAVAAGKLGVAVARGASVPEGWIIDKDGNPSTDPADLRNGGAVLPLGGPEGHKGYGLVRDGRDTIRHTHRLGFRTRPVRPPQRRLLYGGVQRGRIPSNRSVQARGNRIRPIPEEYAHRRRLFGSVLPRRTRASQRTPTAPRRHRRRRRHMGRAQALGGRIRLDRRPAVGRLG